MTDLAVITKAIAATDQPDAVFQGLCDFADALVGVKLFTVLTIDEPNALVRRAWSNMPEAYPVQGTKPMPPDDRFAKGMRTGEPMVTDGNADMVKTFFDHELISSLGCESCVNLPIIVAGEALGTLNLLHEAGHWTPERLQAVDQLRVPGAAAFMVARLFG